MKEIMPHINESKDRPSRDFKKPDYGYEEKLNGEHKEPIDNSYLKFGENMQNEEQEEIEIEKELNSNGGHVVVDRKDGVSHVSLGDIEESEDLEKDDVSHVSLEDIEKPEDLEDESQYIHKRRKVGDKIPKDEFWGIQAQGKDNRKTISDSARERASRKDVRDFLHN